MSIYMTICMVKFTKTVILQSKILKLRGRLDGTLNGKINLKIKLMLNGVICNLAKKEIKKC